MSSPFFTVGSNSLGNPASPWITRLGAGFGVVYRCNSCARTLHGADGPIEAELDPRKGARWFDVVGCGAFPLLVVSERVVNAWQTENLGDLPCHPLTLLPPFPPKLRGIDPPKYYWIDGARLRGALLDFDASGFVDVEFCPECGTRSDDVRKTSQLQLSRPWPYVLRQGSWTGLPLFTTDLSDTAFFCTDVLVSLAARHRLTNFRFIALEDCRDASRMVRYM
jgi:hypothetical protein